MGLEVSLILALAEGNFHTRNTKKATFGTSSKMSQNRTLRRQSMLLICVLHMWKCNSVSSKSWGYII